MDPSIITTLGGCFVEPIKEHCGYLFHYDTNIENRRDQIEKLRAKRNTLLTQIEQDTRNNKAPASDLLKWVDDAEKILDKEVEAQKKCLEIEGWGPDYYLSRKAKKKSLQIDKLLSEAAPYVTQMSYSRSLTGIGSSSSEGIKHFESRTTMEDKVLEALADDKVNMVVICGMGGIGKTTMAEEVAKRAKDGKLFDEFVMAVVSRTPNWTKIQDQIAVMLGLNFDNEVGRAKKLSSRLRNSNSVLVILDDVWQALNLGDIGIPYGGEVNCCKILLTSRSEEVLINKKKVPKFFKIDDLSEEEAWNLFREAAGNCVDDTPDIHSIAKAVAKECGRLPQAIVTVGGVLQNESLVEWRAALEQLQNSTPENIPGLDPTVYSSIEFSYSYLKDDAVKSCFLLCCLFPEDSDIPIEYLVRYGVGKGLFEMIDNVAVARDRVHAIIKNLKRSSLLLDSKKEECVKMHDVIRDVAISIAKKEKGFLVRCNDKIEEWPKQDTYEHSAISLVSQELKKHPECSKCPKLELLQLACGKNCTKTQTFPSNMFEEMKKLKVLSMEGMSFPSLPQSILVLQNLRTLLLEYCKIEDVSELRALGKLEILSFLGSNIKELQREIGNLSHLKLLDLSNCSALQKIPPGLLSRLNYLEELYMFGVNVKWEPMEGNKEGAIASLAELKSLSKRFSALKIHIPNIGVLPKDLLFKNPKLKFQIFAGEEGIYQKLSGTGSYLFENSLALERSDASAIAESPVLLQLLKKSEILYLKQIKDLKNILYELDQEGFQCLKILRVFASEDVEYVIDATSHQTPRADFPFLHSLELSDLRTLKEIYHGQFPERSFGDGQHQLTCFGNLKSLKLSKCMHLKNVFSFSIARGLVQLQQLVIDSCVIMEAIFLKGEDEKAIDEIMFLQLTSIELSSLPSLIGFCTTVYPVKRVQPYSNQEVRRIGTDEVTSFEKNKMTDIQQHSSSTSISHKFFSSKTILWPPNLERLFLRGNSESLEFQKDSSLEEIFNLEGLKVDHAILTQLKTLKVQELPNLVYMWKNVPRGIQGFRSLTSIEVYNCDSLSYLLPPSVAKLLVELQSIKIKVCGVIQNIVQRDGEEEPADIMVFPKVTSFTLEDLPNLASFCIDAYSFGWPSMKEISLGKCPKLKTFGSESQRPKKLKNISRALDSLGFLGQCLECVDRNYDPTVVSDRGTTKNSKRSSSVNKEGTLIRLKNPRASGIDNPTEIWSLFPSQIIESSRNLESIKLWRCDSLEVIFQLEELNAEESTVLDQLRELDLSYLPKLKHVWKKGPERIMGFGNLRFLAVWACNSLTYLLSPSIAKLLVMLEDIRVMNCEKIEEILGKAREEEEEKEISFCKVKSILLKDLPNLEFFCNEVNAFEWPSMNKISLDECPKLKTFGSESQRPKKLKKISRALDSLGFLGQCLECVDRNYDPTVVSDRGTTKNSKRSSSVNKEGTLIKLKNPRASGIDNPTEIWSLFPSHMIESLRNLESIKLWRCDSLEVIFQLEELNAEESRVASVLDQLRELDLSYLPKLKHVWKKGSERIMGFGNLRFLAVWACNSLTYLLSPSIAKLLVMLEDIRVINCEKIEEILERAREEEEEKEISFCKVNSILLKDLPNLKCFCNEVDALEWPLLNELTVIRCPALSTFGPSVLNTPQLKRVYYETERDKRRTFPLEGGLNATIERIFEAKEKQVDQETQLQGKNVSSVEGGEDLMRMEIIKPITEKIEGMDAVSVTVTIGGYFVDPIKKHCGYLFQYNSNIKNLEDRIGNLQAKIDWVQSKIDAAKRNGQVILPVVERWVEKARNFLDEDAEANKKGLGGWCPRYSLSRKAEKKTLEIDVLLNDGQFSEVSSPPPPLGIESLSIEGIMYSESRTKMRREVLEALRADKVNMIAICGMGGIGKTTMAKDVAVRAKRDKLFDEVVMAVVSQNLDLRNIQVQIADMIGLYLIEKNWIERAVRLKKRLMDSKSVLVILDDVWDALDLEAVGIPYGGQHNRCKILLTSRSEEACTQMKAQRIFRITLLPKEEAWNLFREMAGDCINTPSLHPIAKEVAKECGGLPNAIVTVGRALENKSEFEWRAALQQLKNAIPKNIPGLDSKVYSSVELSYSYLKSDEAKSCFLLCSLFPEDSSIPIEHLVRYGMGQRLFAKIDTVAEARNRVHAIVKNLKRSFLLLDSEEGEQFVKMHDVVRDVAISIAENHGFLVRCNENMEEWPERDSCERSTAISLVSKELKRHPDDLECPKLELLQLRCYSGISQTLPPNLFKGMKGLKVLSLFGMSFPSLPQSIIVLQNLRTLQFISCEITDVSAIGELRKLEILSFIGSKIKELPEEMRNLSYLKLLELTKCSDLERIPPDLLSTLSHLEELYMFGVDVKWKPMEEEEEKKRANASLTELMSLSYLVALKIQIPNIKVLPKDLPFKNETIKFQIFAGKNMKIDEHNFTEYYDYSIKNSLGIASCDVSDIAESRMLLQLFKKSEILKLKEIKDLKNIVYELDEEGFQCLKVLEVGGSDDVEYVMDATSDQNPRAAFPTLESLELVDLPNLKEIYHSQFPKRSFSGIHSQLACFGKLRLITLVCCRSLKNVFSLSIARGLFQLQELEIDDCDDMEECFHKEGEDEKALIDKTMFPQLTSVRLESLPGLIAFCTGVGPVEVGRIGTNEVTNLEKHKMTDIKQHTGPFPKSTPIISHKLFSSNTILWPPNLENLDLTKADSLQVVFDLEGLKVDEDHQRIAVLAQLKTLEVKSSSKLGHVWKNVPQGIQGFQKLTSIKVSECHCLRYLFPTSIAKLLVELQSIRIEVCDAIENIVQRDGEEEATDIISFPRVSSLKLQYLPNMMSFCIKAYSFEWSSIKEIYLRDCPKLKTIGSEIQSPRKSKKINRELDSRPNEHELGSPGFHWRCLECVPRRKNYDLMAVSDQGTTNKSQRSYSVKEEGTLSKPNDPTVGDSNNPLEIWSLFPSHIVECLKNLELIELIDVPSLEVIFQLEELNVEESHMAPVLDQLRELDLSNLPKLMHIWKKGPKRILGFGNLRLLTVSTCNSLTYLFSPSIAKLLVMLEKIEVSHCEKIKEILARAREEDEKKYFSFDKVKSIVLRNLPNLKCFCSETNALDWPLLEKIRVIECPSLSTFIPSDLKTPKLGGVYDELPSLWKEGTSHWMGELNATIEHIFKGKEKQVNHKTQQEEQIEIIEEDM